MPAGELVTEPEPVPAKETVNVTEGTNVAVTVTFEFIATVHVPVPVHAPPLQPVNTELPCGAAVRDTLEPEVNVEEHVAPQLIPVGELVTCPVPVPALVIDRV